MKVGYYLLVLFLYVSCQTKNEVRDKHFEPEIKLVEPIKDKIYTITDSAYPNRKYFSLIITRLRSTVFVNIHPIYDSTYFNSKGYPYQIFENKGKLFLVYCGLERLIILDSTQVNKLRSVFNNDVSKISDNNIIHDDSDIFLQFENGKWVVSTKQYEREFYRLYNDLKEEAPKADK